MEKFKFDQKPVMKLLLDPDYVPIVLANRKFCSAVKSTINPELVKIAIVRSKGQIATKSTYVFNESDNQLEANYLYIERLIKTLIWLKGGYKIIFGGPKELGMKLQAAYQANGER